MKNLLQETKDDIKRSGHSPSDIIFIGSDLSGHECTWDEFERLANVQYDDGFGAQEVAKDLIIVFSDGVIMKRVEYDGSEQWDYSAPFTRPIEKKPIHSLIASPELVGWCTLSEINGG